MNCIVIYLVSRAKLELQNDPIFATNFLLEISFKLLFSDISTFYLSLMKIEGYPPFKLTGAIIILD